MWQGSSFGTNFKITTWGESHGTALGVTIDGCPAESAFAMMIYKKSLTGENPVLIHTEQKDRKAIKLLFFPEYLKEKQQVLL